MKPACHKPLLPNLKRVEGQVRGIQNMINDQLYCIDIIDQINAIISSLSSVKSKILKKHIENCVRSSLVSEENLDKKIEEIIKAIKKN